MLFTIMEDSGLDSNMDITEAKEAGISYSANLLNKRIRLCPRCGWYCRKRGLTSGGVQRFLCGKCNKAHIDKLQKTEYAAGKMKRLAAAFGLIGEGYSARMSADFADIAPNTLSKYLKQTKDILSLNCGCGGAWGHRGWCDWQLERHPKRQAYLDALRTLDRSRVYLQYPYIEKDPNEEHDLILIVHRAVPSGLRAEIRADVCQDMLLDLISGTLQKSDIPSEVQRYIRQAYKHYQLPFGHLSIDAPMGNDPHGRKLGDLIAAEY